MLNRREQQQETFSEAQEKLIMWAEETPGKNKRMLSWKLLFGRNINGYKVMHNDVTL